MTHRYDTEYYRQNRKRILENQKEYYLRHHKEKLEKRKSAYLKSKEIRQLRSAKEEDIQRNVNLFFEGKELDMSLKKLGPEFKKRILQVPLSPVEKRRICRECKGEFRTYQSHKRLCSPDCEHEWRRKIRNDYHREYHQKMRRNPILLIKMRLRDRLKDAIRYYLNTGKIRKTEEYMDYQKIIEHLGPCPGNREEWHIDHIVSLRHFNLADEEQIRKAFLPENLRWYPCKNNLKEHHRSLEESEKILGKTIFKKIKPLEELHAIQR